jgi:hypothetical protein
MMFARVLTLKRLAFSDVLRSLRCDVPIPVTETPSNVPMRVAPQMKEAYWADSDHK